MTCPTTAVFDGMPGVEPTDDSVRIDIGKKLRFFGDGNQKSKVLDGRRYWRVPVMDGEFVVEETVGAVKATWRMRFSTRRSCRTTARRGACADSRWKRPTVWST
jgi:formylmethanofuran--tetrahydromethanopterin N-formyltransferase